MHTTPVRRPRRTVRLLATSAAVAGIAGLAGPTQATPVAASVESVSGTLADGTAYRIEMPADWNGTLALYSHGLVFPGDDNPPRPAVDEAFGRHLLEEGVALAGSAFPSGWAVEDAFRDQRATVDVVAAKFGKPSTVVAYGDSLGGMISTGLVERHPGEFAGAVAMCGVEAGAVGSWNHFLDTAFVFKTLLASATPLRVTGIADPIGNAGLAAQTLQQALQTPAGRARLALVAAVAQLPGGRDPSGPSTATTLAKRFDARMDWLQAPFLPLAFAERGEMEARAGGNPSWNTGVDYTRMLLMSHQAADVLTMYAKAGLSLQADLKALGKAPRVQADPDATGYLRENVTFSGKLQRPVLTIRNVSDGALPSSQDRAYTETVAAQGRSSFLRQAFVDRPGHCTFTPAESLVAFETVLARVRTGAWPSTSPTALKAAAVKLGPELNQGPGFPVPPAFVSHHPLAFPRPFTVS